MWPFENSLRNQLRNQDIIKKYREWLRKWMFKGNNKFNTLTLMGLVAIVALASAYGFYTWHNNQAAKAVISPNNTNQTINQNWKQAPPPVAKAAKTKEVPATQAVANPEEMVKPVMGHVLTNVGMTFSEVFKDYRYNTGVALAAKPGTEVKNALAGTVSLISTGENDTKVISINHGNGLESSYSGLVKVKVQAGQRISQNEVLGTLGEYTRTNGVMENHLYFKITKNGEPLDPNIYWK